MDDDEDLYVRILARAETMRGGKGRPAAWLAEKLGSEVQRVQNWKNRGVPASAHAKIAAALHWTVDQLLGLSDPPGDWPFETIAPQRWAALSERQRAMVELVAVREIERIESETSKRDGTND